MTQGEEIAMLQEVIDSQEKSLAIQQDIEKRLIAIVKYMLSQATDVV